MIKMHAKNRLMIKRMLEVLESEIKRYGIELDSSLFADI